MNKKFLLMSFPILLLLVCLFMSSLFINIADGSTGNPPQGTTYLPGGSFEMGTNRDEIGLLAEMGRKVPHMDESLAYSWFKNEIPRHVVKVQPFHIDIYEVTNRKFSKFVSEAGYQAQGNWKKWYSEDRLDHPVVGVTWNDARAYCRWRGGSLPTEEQWEYAAKGGREVKWFPWGNEPDPDMANYRYQGENILEGLVRLMGLRKIGTTPVGSFPPNGYGLYDMCGNVSEWTRDKYLAYPGGPEDEYDGEERVVRGGNWDSPNAVFIRINFRRGDDPKYREYNLGFRCVVPAED